MHIKKTILLLLIFILFHIETFAQQTVLGYVRSDGKDIPYATIQVNSSDRKAYTDSNGYFQLSDMRINDTLMISCIGYDIKEIILSQVKNDLEIELEKNTDFLDEMVIHVINSKWQKLFKKHKPNRWRNFAGLLEGYSLIARYKATDDIRFNGVAFFAKNNSEHLKKILRPLLFKDSITTSTSQIENQFKEITYTKPNSSKDHEHRIEFVFNQIVELKKGEEMYIGIELISNNIENINIKNTIMFAEAIDAPLSMETAMYSFLFQNKFRNGYYERVPIIENLYFELKVLE